MPIIRNVSPLGDLDVPLLRQIVQAGSEVETTAEHAATLLAQSENFAAVDEDAHAIADSLFYTPAHAVDALEPTNPAGDADDSSKQQVADSAASEDTK